MKNYDQTPTSINTLEELAAMQAEQFQDPSELEQVAEAQEDLVEAQERLEQILRVFPEAGGLATAAAREDLAQSA